MEKPRTKYEKHSFILRQTEGWGASRGEQQHDGLEKMDPRFPTPLFVSECHKRALHVYMCMRVCVWLGGEYVGSGGMLGCVTESLSALIA